jgi:peptidase E
LYHQLIAAGELSDGWAADDGAALVFRGETLTEVVASRTGAAAHRVEKSAEHGVVERRTEARYLGKP